jgi:2-keto-4-pentenoate hydratase/2-oxohepta-3-ene-1,7-dioic acid hydratase in catechol pathway
MKIICIGRNYNHIEELKNERPTEPVVLWSRIRPFYWNSIHLLEFSEDVHHEIEIIVKISKVEIHRA